MLRVAEKLHDAGVQGVFRAYNLEPFIPDQRFQDFRTMPQPVHRRPDIGADRCLDELFTVCAVMPTRYLFEQVFHRRSNGIHDMPEIR